MSVDMSRPRPPRQSINRLDRLIQNPGEVTAIYQLWQSSQDQQDVNAVRAIWDYQTLKPRPHYLDQQYKPLNEFTFFDGVDNNDPLAKIDTPNPIPYEVLAQRTGNYPVGAWWRGSRS